MQYLTYEEYQQNGGAVELSAFPALEKKARYKLDYYTQHRIVAPITEAVKDCMTELISLLQMQGQGEKVTSFANDGVSVNFAQTDDEQNFYLVILQTLPQELTYLGV